MQLSLAQRERLKTTLAEHIDRQDGVEPPFVAAANGPAPKFVNATQSFVDLRVFYMFPFLPTELRLNIWEAMLPGARIVHVSRNTVTQTSPSKASSQDMAPIVSCPFKAS